MSTTKSGGGGIQDIVKTAQRMQQQITRVQEKMADHETEVSAGGGAVVATVNGRQELVSLRIDPDAVDPTDVATLEELVLTAVNRAMANSQEMVQSEVNRITGGLNIPGLF
jgi:DNA-binding YbaB/EbfC family protein